MKIMKKKTKSNLKEKYNKNIEKKLISKLLFK